METMKTKSGTTVPKDLAAALEGKPGLLALWQRLRPARQREHVESVLGGKRSEARRKRIAEVIKATVEWNEHHPLRTTTDRSVKRILAELKAAGNESGREGMRRYGINVENALGVSIYDLRKMAKTTSSFLASRRR
jgi:hypothetical protein